MYLTVTKGDDEGEEECFGKIDNFAITANIPLGDSTLEFKMFNKAATSARNIAVTVWVISIAIVAICSIILIVLARKKQSAVPTPNNHAVPPTTTA